MDDAVSNPFGGNAKALYRAHRWLECAHAVEGNLRKGLLVSASDHVFRVRALNKLRRAREALAAALEGVKRCPGDPTLLALLAQAEREAGRDLAAFRRYLSLVRAGDAGEPLAALFGILIGRGRFSAAQRLAPLLSNRAGKSVELDANLAVAALLRHDCEEAKRIVAASRKSFGEKGRTTRLGEIADALGREMAAGDTMAGLRHIAIAGISFVGSTVFGIVLGSAPDHAHAGETHWLTDVRGDAGEQKIDITAVSEERWPENCRLCGRGCHCFTNTFRRELAADETGWHAKIARRLGTRNLVTSDKNVHKIWLRDPLFRFDLALLFKSPLQQAKSMLKRAVRDDPKGGEDWLRERLDINLDKWAEAYIGHLKLLKPRRRVVIDWECFVADPQPHLTRIADLLKIPIPPDVLDHIRPGHFIGGNPGVDAASIAAAGRLDLRVSDAASLPKDLEGQALGHRRATFVYSLLKNEYRRQFGL